MVSSGSSFLACSIFVVVSSCVCYAHITCLCYCVLCVLSEGPRNLLSFDHDDILLLNTLEVYTGHLCIACTESMIYFHGDVNLTAAVLFHVNR
jgi:hypothetical protein